MALTAPSASIRWLSPDPALTAGRVARALGVPSRPGVEGSGFVIDLAGGRIEFVAVPPGGGQAADERLVLVADDERAAAGAATATVAGAAGLPPQLGIGWATVDLERAAALLGEWPSPALGEWPSPALGEWPSPAPADDLLGARAALVSGTPSIVLLEPNTEGRIAASLVRHAEGPAAIYVGFDGRGGFGGSRGFDGGSSHRFSAHLAALREQAVRFSAPASGPFGQAVAIAGGPAWGPHLVLVETDAAAPGTATIRP